MKTAKPVLMAPNHSDDMQTPPEALLPLLPYLPRDWRIWEPACGKGNLVRGLRGHGYEVLGTDVQTGNDFFTYEPPVFDWHCIVTNPPYRTKTAIVARCYELGKPWALLLPYAALETEKRQRMYREHGVQVLLMPWRVNFEVPSGKGSSAWFPTLWMCWGLNLPSDLTFAAPAAQPALFGEEGQ
jgi:hypothetical protein